MHTATFTHRHHKKRARGGALLTATSVQSARSRASCTNPYDPRLMSLTLMYFSLLSKGSDSVRSAPCILLQRAPVQGRVQTSYIIG